MATWIELLAWFQAFEERLLWVSSPLWGQREDGVYNQRHTFVAPTTRIMRYSCYQWQARSTRTCRGLHHPHRACNDTGADYIIFWLIRARKLTSSWMQWFKAGLNTVVWPWILSEIYLPETLNSLVFPCLNRCHSFLSPSSDQTLKQISCGTLYPPSALDVAQHLNWFVPKPAELTHKKKSALYAPR